MTGLSCKNCGGLIQAEDSMCPNCGLPLPPNHASQKQRIFVRWFIILVIFCVVMMLWLPPDWSTLGG